MVKLEKSKSNACIVGLSVDQNVPFLYIGCRRLRHDRSHMSWHIKLVSHVHISFISAELHNPIISRSNSTFSRMESVMFIATDEHGLVLQVLYVYLRSIRTGDLIYLKLICVSSPVLFNINVPIKHIINITPRQLILKFVYRPIFNSGRRRGPNDAPKASARSPLARGIGLVSSGIKNPGRSVFFDV